MSIGISEQRADIVGMAHKRVDRAARIFRIPDVDQFVASSCDNQPWWKKKEITSVSY